MLKIIASGLKCRNYLILSFFLLQVLKPINEYKGQKLIKLVIKDIVDKTISTKPKEPSIILKK